MDVSFRMELQAVARRVKAIDTVCDYAGRMHPEQAATLFWMMLERVANSQALNDHDLEFLNILKGWIIEETLAIQVRLKC